MDINDTSISILALLVWTIKSFPTDKKFLNCKKVRIRSENHNVVNAYCL